MDSTEKKKTGLYFGSFNPIHFGHLILANHIAQNTDLKEIWFVVSPQNPLKKASTLLDNQTRLNLVRLAIEGNDSFRASDIEFSLPVPSYTVRTLAFLSDKYPDREFVLIMGEDNLVNFPRWKNYETILRYYNIYVYPRENCVSSPLLSHPHIHRVDAPLVNISASYIRSLIKQGKSISYLVPDNVRDEIEKAGLYR